MNVLRLGFVHLAVTDLPAAREHYVNLLGLEETAEVEGRVYLKAWDEWDHHSLVLEEGGSGLIKMGWKLRDEGALEEAERASEQFGVSVSRSAHGEDLGIGPGFQCLLPTGHMAAFYADAEVLGSSVGNTNPGPWPRGGVTGVGVPFLSHLAITASDVPTAERYFEDVLGFRTAERVVPALDVPQSVVSFLSCGSQVHDIAIIPGEDGRLHHVAYELESWNEVLRAGDMLSMSDTPIDVGPTRHGATRGQTLYFFDPTGNRNEVFAGGYRMSPDRPTVTWTLDEMARSIFYIDRRIPEQFTTVVS